jgi:hypothetical protein
MPASGLNLIGYFPLFFLIGTGFPVLMTLNPAKSGKLQAANSKFQKNPNFQIPRSETESFNTRTLYPSLISLGHGFESCFLGIYLVPRFAGLVLHLICLQNPKK